MVKTQALNISNTLHPCFVALWSSSTLLKTISLPVREQSDNQFYKTTAENRDWLRKEDYPGYSVFEPPPFVNQLICPRKSNVDHIHFIMGGRGTGEEAVVDIHQT